MNRPAIFIITGERGEGKTTFAAKLALILQENNFAVKGIIAERYTDGPATGFMLTDPAGGISIPLAGKTGTGSENRTGSFIFSREAIKKGNSIISDAIQACSEVIFIDEVGAGELDGKIWAKPLEMLLKTYPGILVLTVRKKFLERVTCHWQIDPVAVFDVKTVNPSEASQLIISSK